VDFQRRGAVERRAREAAVSEAGRADWSVAPPAVVEHDLDAGLLRRLPPDQQRAIAAHVLHRRRYGQIASESATSEASIRQRVSRGLRTLRGPLRVYRAAGSSPVRTAPTASAAGMACSWDRSARASRWTARHPQA
jgi:DNA-directed RNA polymerase specialized sigma24 family protein